MSVLITNPAEAATSGRQLNARSVDGRSITANIFGDGASAVLMIGGIHGNEPSGARLVAHVRRWLALHPSAYAGRTVVLVAKANPDGLAHHTRTNARGVDLNRNFPSSDWGTKPRRNGDNPGVRPASEPATRFLLKRMARFRPWLIVSVHAPYHQVDIDGPAMAVARRMSRHDHDRITRSIGYPVPGSLGTYAGKEKHISVVTLELGRRSDQKIWRAQKAALLAAIRHPCGA
ncbi:DUF2817 domain-containing protein [Jiella sp. M17.18]|uniref:DUF2817 domain-containing protein n=1 Tax=Jiella sp. M17.18 TaxID=3234247 RepID=UPI0034DFC90A